jgi:hypothetical protein
MKLPNVNNCRPYEQPVLRGSNKTLFQEQLLPRDTTSASRAPPWLASRGRSRRLSSGPGHPDTSLNRESEHLRVLRAENGLGREARVYFASIN